MSVPPPPAAPGGQPAPYGNQPPVPAGNQGAFGPPPGQFGTPPGQPPAAPPPGQPGAFGPPPGQAFGPPPGQPMKKRRFPVWLMIVIPIVVIGLGALGVVGFLNSPNSAAVGDCLQITEFKQGTEPSKMDCADQNANVKIAVKLDSSSSSCPTGDYDEYSVTGSGSYKLCLMINAHDGDCFANVTSGTDGYKRVPCTDPTAEIEFLKIVTGQAGEAACEGLEFDGAITYSEPATTMCAVAKNGARA